MPPPATTHADTATSAAHALASGRAPVTIAPHVHSAVPGRTPGGHVPHVVAGADRPYRTPRHPPTRPSRGGADRAGHGEPVLLRDPLGLRGGRSAPQGQGGSDRRASPRAVHRR